MFLKEMLVSNNREERQLQKLILHHIFKDYNAKQHDIFVYEYNKIVDNYNQLQYQRNRGIAE